MKKPSIANAEHVRFVQAQFMTSKFGFCSESGGIFLSSLTLQWVYGNQLFFLVQSAFLWTTWTLYFGQEYTLTSEGIEGNNNEQGEASPSTVFIIKAENKTQKTHACLALSQKNFLREMASPLKIYQLSTLN